MYLLFALGPSFVKKELLPLIEETVAETTFTEKPDIRLPADGAVAYVSPVGCQVVWEPNDAAGDWAHCDDVRWDKAIQHPVQAGVDFAVISFEWDKVYAPWNWS